MSQSTETAPMAAGNPDRLTGLRTFWHYFSVNRGAVIGLFVFILLVLAALFAPLLAPYAPDVQDKTAFLRPPAWQAGGSTEFLLGTDPVGRDILSRLLYGARFSLLIGAVVVSLALVGGITLGLLAGYFRGWVDVMIMRVMDLILAFPSLLLALVLVTILGPGLFNAMLAIALVLQPHFARLVRAAVMAEKSREYVVAAKVAGAGHLRLMLATILPNCLAPLIVQGTLSFSNAILEAAALGFLGLGAQPPLPEWGAMISAGRRFILDQWWVATMPGLAIFTVSLGFNLLGDGLRDVLDPKRASR
jgi:dipeptide transport system permease protein